jgi:hypothetical protein
MDALISLLVFAVILALVFWVLSTIPMAQPFRTIVIAIVCIVALVWLLGTLGYVAFP